MSQEVYNFEVTQKSFPSLVLENSNKIPVVVEFMGVWSEPCIAVEGIFSRLAKEFAGQFIFAKVDMNEQPELGSQYQIENVPTLVVIKDGQTVRVDMGQVNEDEARALLKEQGISHESDDMREQAREKHLAGDTPSAIMLLTQAIQKDPSNTRVAMDMVQIFLDIGDLNNASGLFSKLPERDRESDIGKALNGQMTFMSFAAKTDGIETLQTKVDSNFEDHKSRFDLAVCLVAKYDYIEAVEQLLKIIEVAPDFQDGAAREMIATIIRNLKPASPELASEFQRKLSNILVS